MEDPFSELAQRLHFYSVAPEPVVSAEAVAEFEAEAGFTLPEDYRTFLQHHGLSTAPALIFPSPDQPEEPGGGVGVFFGLQPHEDYDLLEEWEDIQERLPGRWLPIATSPGGLICLAISGKNRGNIWWIPDTAKGTAKTGFRIASSFTDFINLLRIYPEG